MNIIPTPDMMWEAHRAALNGRPCNPGAPLPEHLADCPPRAQAAHYAMALVAVLCVDGDPSSVPVPGGIRGITLEEAHSLRGKMLKLLEPYRLRAAVNALKRIVAADPEPSDCESDAATIEAELARLHRENERLRRMVDWMITHDHQHAPALMTYGVDEQAVGKAAVAELAKIGFAKSREDVQAAQAQLRAEALAAMPATDLLQLIYATRRHVLMREGAQHPEGCAKCGQINVGQSGEYPCSACGLPTTWDLPDRVADAPMEAQVLCQSAVFAIIRALGDEAP